MLASSTNIPEANSDTLFKTISNGTYNLTISETDFKKALNGILISSECVTTQTGNTLFSIFKCDTPEQKNLFNHLVLKEIFDNNSLNNFFDFFTKYITADKKNIISDDNIKKLILLGTHYTTMYEAKINEANIALSENDIVTTSSFINFLNSLLNIHNITEFESPKLIHHKVEGERFPNITFGDSQKIDILAKNTIKLSEDLVNRSSTLKSFKKENLIAFLESLGNFGFQLKIKNEFQDDFPRIPVIAKIILWSKNSNFSKKDRELAGYIFLYGLDDKDQNQIKADCVDLLSLEACPRPFTASIQLFQQIAQGNYTNQKPPFSDYVQVVSEIKENSNMLNRDQSIHVLTFLKNVLKANSGSENTYNFKILYQFANNSINNLSNNLQQKNLLDDSFAQAAESLSFFLFNIVKNDVKGQNLFDQIYITKFGKLYENIIIQAPHLKSLLDTMGNHLFSILFRNIDSPAALETSHLIFIKIVKDLNKVCREYRNDCNLPKILAKSFKCLGNMSRKSSIYSLNATKEAKDLIEKSRIKLNPEQLSEAVSFFFKANISQTEIDLKCHQIFNLTGCRPASQINFDYLAYGEIGEMTTLQAEEHLDTITSTTQIAVPISTSNQTIAAVIVDSNVATELPAYSNSTPSNQTFIDTDANHNETQLSNPGLTLGAAAAHGVGAGLLNGVIQHFAAKYSRQGQHASTTKAMIIYSSLFAHAALAATFPLMLFKIQEHINQGNEDEAQQLWDNLLLQALPTFISSASFSIGLHLLSLCTQFIPNQARAIAQNTVPLLGTAVNLFRNPVATGVQMATSIAISSLTYGLFNRISPVNNTNFLDVEKPAEGNTNFEMEPLKKENDTNNAINKIEKDLTPEEIFFEKNKFISLENLNKMAKYLKEIIDDTQAFSDMQILQPSKELLHTRLTALKNLHEGLKSKDFIKLPKDETAENVEIQFRSNCESLKVLIESINKELQTGHSFSEDKNLKADLNKIEGLNFKDHTFEFKSKLGEIKDNIGFIDTIIKTAFSPSVPDKPQKNRRNTICFFSNGSDSKTRSSIASSSDESSKSDGYGNTTFNDSKDLEAQSLLQTRLNR